MQKRETNSVIFNTGQIFVWSRDETAVTFPLRCQKMLTRGLLRLLLQDSHYKHYGMTVEGKS